MKRLIRVLVGAAVASVVGTSVVGVASTASAASAAGRGPNVVAAADLRAFDASAFEVHAPSAVALSGLVLRADVPAGHDYWARNCAVGEAGAVCGNWSVNNTPDATYWTLVQDEKYNAYGGFSQVRFRSISHSGYVLPSRTMGNGATHCWFPGPPYDGYPVSGCAPHGESHATAFDGQNFSTTYKVTVQGYGSGDPVSCYVATPFADTVVAGACAGAP